MNLSKYAVFSLMLGVSAVSALLTHLYESRMQLLSKHGIRISEEYTDGGSILRFYGGGNRIFASMEFDASNTKASNFSISDFDSTVLRALDKNQDGKIDSLSLSVIHDGVAYAYSDPFLEGDYSRLSKARDGEDLGSFLKIGGKWLPAKHAGTKGIVTIDGTETVVDPNKSPIAILGPLVQKPDAPSKGE